MPATCVNSSSVSATPSWRSCSSRRPDLLLSMRAGGRKKEPLQPCGGRGELVEAAGQPIPSLSRRAGLCLHPAVARATAGAGRVIRNRSLRILVPARVMRRQPVYESLQGGPEVGPLSTPRRYHCRRHLYRWLAPSGFADVSPVITSPLRVKATQVDRTRVRKHYATGHYMLSSFFDSRCTLPEEQGRRTASFRAF